MAHLVKVSKLGRSFERGKALSEDFRRLVIDDILRNGGNRATGEFDGSLKDISLGFNIYGNTVRNIWERFCVEYNKQPIPKAGGNPSNLNEDDLKFIKILKTERGSISLKEIYKLLEDFGGCAATYMDIFDTLLICFYNLLHSDKACAIFPTPNAVI